MVVTYTPRKSYRILPRQWIAEQDNLYGESKDTQFNDATEPERSSFSLVGKRAVIVEDEGVTQLQLRRSLARLGLVIAGVANTAESGVEVVLRERPDIVLMDIRMPGKYDGLEGARRILAEYKVCVIMLTAYALEEYQSRAREIGVCAYLLKPVVSESLAVDLEKAYNNFN